MGTKKFGLGVYRRCLLLLRRQLDFGQRQSTSRAAVPALTAGGPQSFTYPNPLRRQSPDRALSTICIHGMECAVRQAWGIQAETSVGQTRHRRTDLLRQTGQVRVPFLPS